MDDVIIFMAILIVAILFRFIYPIIYNMKHRGIYLKKREPINIGDVNRQAREKFKQIRLRRCGKS